MARPLRRLPALVLLVCIGTTVRPVPAAEDRARLEAAGLATIEAAALREHVEVLASDEFEGRKPGTAGEEKSLRYLQARFREIGLRPVAGDSYLQPVRLLSQQVQPDGRLELRAPGGKKATWRVGGDALVNLIGEEAELSVPPTRVVFAGHGIFAPERGWDDYAGLDVEGAVVLALDGEPTDPEVAELFDAGVPTYYSTPGCKKAEAGRRGAVGIVFVHREVVSGFPWAAVGGQALGERWSVSAPPAAALFSAAVREEHAREALALAGLDLDALVAAAARADFAARPLSLELSAKVRARRGEIDSANVVGLLRGSERPEEHVIYTAHWDHVGVGEPVDGDAVRNGAVDNATGVAALLEIAEAFVSLPRAPRRSVLFVATTAEEMGLLGAKHYARDPLLPLADAVAVLNMDALFPFGAQNGMTVTGHGQSELDEYLGRAVVAEGRRVQPDPTPQAGAWFRSDHHPLAEAGVPAIFAVGGPLPDPPPSPELIALYQDFMTRRYHQPADELHEGWDFAGIVQDARIFFRTGLALAEDERRPNWRLDSPYRRAGDRRRR